jgi:NAD(P)-dependent dehydrogenase (short-subunit alcohol dehydrogenase family)
MSRFTDGQAPRVLITGAGGGVGLACAEALAACGAELILCDIDGTALTRAADRLNGFSRFCDAIAESSVDVFAAEIGERFATIDVLINAAGRGYVRSLAMTRMSRALMPLLRCGHGQRLVVNIAPAAGPRSRDGMFPFASSQGAFERLSEALAEQVRGTMIEVITLAPATLRVPPLAGAALYRLHEFECPDDRATAQRVVATVASARPNWRGQQPPIGRRA